MKVVLRSFIAAVPGIAWFTQHCTSYWKKITIDVIWKTV